MGEKTGPRSKAVAVAQSLTAEQVRWRCNPDDLAFESTADVDPITGVIGQDAAVEALRYGVETRAPGQNVFIRGLVGTGRLTLVRHLMEEMRAVCSVAEDRCYVHCFQRPDRPRLITLPAGQGRVLRRRVDRLADFIRNELQKAMNSDEMRAPRKALEERTKHQVQQITGPFEETLKQAGLGLTMMQLGPLARPVIVPLIDGRPISPDELDQAAAAGRVSPQELERLKQQRDAFQERLREMIERVEEMRSAHEEEAQRLYETQARALLDRFVSGIREEFPQPAVAEFLQEVIDDVIEHRLIPGEPPDGDFTERYRVNLLVSHREDDTSCAIEVETAPTMKNLLGTIDREVSPEGRVRSSHMMIRAGSILRADQGFLILDARDVLSEPGAWKVLVRTLKTERLEIVPPEEWLPWVSPSMTPEPIPINVKVILIGDYEIFSLLDVLDPDFPHLFKVLADFDSTIPRSEQGVELYAGVLARIAREEKLPAFHRTAVAALAEHGARIAAHGARLTSRFGRLADIAREAAHLATKVKRQRVDGSDVREAVARSKRRADLPSRKFREFVREGRIRIQLDGRELGQINGLAVMQAGALTYGFPSRITATIGPGTAGLINIERESALSGAIHTKGFYILGGVLRTLLRTDHPLAFNASVAFEQSYGGIDGDSASGAEVCCLLSALTGRPLRQDVAMTGAVDQQGNILAVGGVNEKIEGFFDACREFGLTGGQGVIIPQANAGDLMLREEVVAAVGEGRFHVWAVSRVQQALEILTGVAAGERGEDGHYPEGSLLATAMDKAYEYWRRAAQRRPEALTAERRANGDERT